MIMLMKNKEKKSDIIRILEQHSTGPFGGPSTPKSGCVAIIGMMSAIIGVLALIVKMI